MQSRLIIKVGFLVLCLIGLTLLMRFFSSQHFKEDLNSLFSSSAKKTMNWCPDHLVDFQILDTSEQLLSAGWAQAKIDEIKSTFCSIEMDEFENIKTLEVEFKPLIKVQSAEAKEAVLEWNQQQQIFRVQGMPLKSKQLVQRILDRK